VVIKANGPKVVLNRQALVSTICIPHGFGRYPDHGEAISRVTKKISHLTTSQANKLAMMAR
jgi:hypothetical protein